LRLPVDHPLLGLGVASALRGDVCLVESGRPIPNERLEAFPTAERTVEEERALNERGAI
jgi:hypothetical protein